MSFHFWYILLQGFSKPGYDPNFGCENLLMGCEARINEACRFLYSAVSMYVEKKLS
jgi:hypothetical protein